MAGAQFVKKKPDVVSALRPAFFIQYLESCISRLNVIPCHDLTLSVGEPDNAAAKLRSEQTVTPLHEQSPATYFLRLNNLETFVELVGARPLHLLSHPDLPIKPPPGFFLGARPTNRGLGFLRAAVEGDKRPGKAPFAGVVFCLIRQPRQKASRLVLWGWHQPPLWRCFIFSCTPSFF